MGKEVSKNTHDEDIPTHGSIPANAADRLAGTTTTLADIAGVTFI